MGIKNNYQIFGNLKNLDKKKEINDKIESIINVLEKQYGFYTTVEENGSLNFEIKGKYSLEEIIHAIETELSGVPELELVMPYCEAKYV